MTGGAGFIGSHIVERLLADGLDVRVLDDFSSGSASNLPVHPSLEVVTGDVADAAMVRSVVEGMDWVFHEAAIASVPRCNEDPLGTAKVNYQGTLNVLEASRHAGVRRVMFAASAAAYGDLPELPKSERSPVKPLSPYAVDKLASEHACAVFYHLYGLETVCLRYFNVYGLRQDPDSPYSGVISIFARRLARGETPCIYGDGEQTRDFVHVSDVVEANVLAARTPSVGGQVFNVGTGKGLSLNAILATMGAVCGSTARPDYAAPRAGDIRHSYAGISLARERLGWGPQVAFEDGIVELL